MNLCRWDFIYLLQTSFYFELKGRKMIQLCFFLLFSRPEMRNQRWFQHISRFVDFPSAQLCAHFRDFEAYQGGDKQITNAVLLCRNNLLHQDIMCIYFRRSLSTDYAILTMHKWIIITKRIPRWFYNQYIVNVTLYYSQYKE